MSIVVVATISPKPEHTDAVAVAFADVIPQVHAEDGCELYALHRAGDQLIMIERWASEEALAVHSRGAALAALNPMLRGKLTAPAQIVVSHPVPAGDPAKGQL
jgi:quinol monooxygenase YgiN